MQTSLVGWFRFGVFLTDLHNCWAVKQKQRYIQKSYEVPCYICVCTHARSWRVNCKPEDLQLNWFTSRKLCFKLWWTQVTSGSHRRWEFDVRSCHLWYHSLKVCLESSSSPLLGLKKLEEWQNEATLQPRKGPSLRDTSYSSAIHQGRMENGPKIITTKEKKMWKSQNPLITCVRKMKTTSLES